jgi:uncharacterized membrane protein YgcG
MHRVRDLLGVAMVGDGLLTLIVPQRRMRRWRVGPRWLRSLTDAFARRPLLTRLAGALTAAGGLAIAVPRSRR